MAILKRTLEMKIRFTKAELDMLNKKAKKAHMSREGYCRAVLNESMVKEAPPVDVPLLLRAMRQAGYNLDQTLKRFNATNVPDMRCSERDWRRLERRQSWSLMPIPPAAANGCNFYLAD